MATDKDHEKLTAAFNLWKNAASSFELFDIFKAGYAAAEQVRASGPSLREQLRDHFAKVMNCQLPCACLRNPQKNDCGALADKALALRPFTVAVD